MCNKFTFFLPLCICFGCFLRSTNEFWSCYIEALAATPREAFGGSSLVGISCGHPPVEIWWLLYVNTGQLGIRVVFRYHSDNKLRFFFYPLDETFSLLEGFLYAKPLWMLNFWWRMILLLSSLGYQRRKRIWEFKNVVTPRKRYWYENWVFFLLCPLFSKLYNGSPG